MKIVFDCSYVAYRSAFGMEELSYNQQKVHVIFDFLRQILKAAEDFKSRDFIFCWDSEHSWRKIYSPTYKLKRGESKLKFDIVDFHRQLNDLRKMVLPYMGFRNSFHQNGYEGDDTIASVVLNNDEDFLIASNDEDLFQLLSDRVHLYNFKRVLDEGTFAQTFYSIQPKDWIQVKAIAGCSGDEVNGIEKVGDITAAKYLAGILPDGKIKKKIESKEGQQIAAFNTPLVRLPYQGPKSLRICSLVDDELSWDMFQMIFKQYGFNSFIKQWDRWEDAFF